MAGSHSLLAPSAAHRWSLCPGSIAACRDESDKSGEDAASGTLTHSMGQAALIVYTEGGIPVGEPKSPWRVGTEHEVEGYKFTIDQDRIDRVMAYRDGVAREPGRLFIERQLDLSNVLGVPNQGGTGDAITLNTEIKRIIVGDLKDGAEVVYAKDNPQLILYALAALDRFSMVCDWVDVKVAIHQPRMHHYDEWIYTVAELMEWQKKLRGAAQEAYALYNVGTPQQILTSLTPGGAQCRWCPIRGKCKARTAAVLALFPLDDVEEPEVHLLTDQDLAAALKQVDEIENWCRDIGTEALKRALAGIKIPAFKLARGRKGNRSWRDDAEAGAMLEMLLPVDQCYKPRKPVSPAEAEKSLKRIGTSVQPLAPLITQSDGALSLVREDDPRAAVDAPKVEFPEDNADE